MVEHRQGVRHPPVSLSRVPRGSTSAQQALLTRSGGSRHFLRRWASSALRSAVLGTSMRAGGKSHMKASAGYTCTPSLGILPGAFRWPRIRTPSGTWGRAGVPSVGVCGVTWARFTTPPPGLRGRHGSSVTVGRRPIRCLRTFGTDLPMVTSWSMH